MKWLKSRNNFLGEAKLRDVILPKQSSQLSSKWGEKYLDYEEVDPNPLLKLGKWKLSEEDKIKALNAFFNTDLNTIYSAINGLSDHFKKILTNSIKLELITSEVLKFVFSEFDATKVTIDQLAYFHDPIFRKLSVGETKASEMILKDESGKPILGEDGKIKKIEKIAGDPIFSNNLVNFTSFITEYNLCYKDHPIDPSLPLAGISEIRNITRDAQNTNFTFDFEIFNKDLYLYISHDPKDILNISVSKFYASCQHFYSGSHNQQLLSNVFDPNSAPAFLVFDSPIHWDGDKLSDQLPLSRRFVRVLENFDNLYTDDTVIFVDRCYPERLDKIMEEMIRKYAKMNVTEERSRRYLYSPDLPPEDVLKDPYMDFLSLAKGSTIGKNARTLIISRGIDWSRIKISPKNELKEIIIETTDLPENFFQIPLNPNWVKFKFLRLKDLSVFSKMNSKSVGFEKCEFEGDVLKDIIKSGLEKLMLTSCDIDQIDLSESSIKELQLIYTLDPSKNIREIVGNLQLSNLVISGDLIKNPDNKKFVSELKSKKISVKIVGPII